MEVEVSTLHQHTPVPVSNAEVSIFHHFYNEGLKKLNFKQKNIVISFRCFIY